MRKIIDVMTGEITEAEDEPAPVETPSTDPDDGDVPPANGK